MKKNRKVFDFYGGMNNVLPPHLLPDNQAELIENLVLNDAGVYEKIGYVGGVKVDKIVDGEGVNILNNAGNVYKWQPARLPAGCTTDYVLIVIYLDKTCVAVYKRDASWHEEPLLSNLSRVDIQVASDATQFLIVDGRANNQTHRIYVTVDGVIAASGIGVPAPTQAPVVKNAVISDADNEGIGLPPGTAFGFCYTYVNEREEESNPSPVTMFDTLQAYKKGQWVKDGVEIEIPVAGAEYINDGKLHGSVKQILLETTIDLPDVKRVNVYLAESAYIEGSAPMSGLLMVASEVTVTGVPKKTIRITMPQSNVMADYERDMASPADDVCLVDGTIFLANPAMRLAIPDVEAIWAISLNNSDKNNIVNMFHKIDLYDDTGFRPNGSAYIKGLNWATVISGNELKKFRIFDTDLTTPLEVFYYPKDANVQLIEPLQDYGDATMAELILGNVGDDNQIRLTAWGADANNINVLFTYGTRYAYVINEDDASTELIFETASAYRDQYLEIIYLDPNSINAELLVVFRSSTNTIEIHLATDGSGGIISTYNDIKAAVESEIGLGGELNGIITLVTKGDPDSEYGEIAKPFATPVLFTRDTQVKVDGSDVTVYLAHDGTAGDSVVATAFEVAGMLNRVITSSGTLFAEVASGNSGFGYVEAMAEPAFLQGGSGIPDSSISRIKTRLMAFVRIPTVYAYSEKTIYLVKLSNPQYTLNEFKKIVTGAAGSGEIRIENFYQTKTRVNPVRSESDLYVTNPHDIPFVPDYMESTGENQRYRMVNKANKNYYDRDKNKKLVVKESPSERFVVPDEYARARSLVIEGIKTSSFSGDDEYVISGGNAVGGDSGIIIFTTKLRSGDLIPEGAIKDGNPRNYFLTHMWLMNINYGSARNVFLYYCSVLKHFLVWCQTNSAGHDHGKGIYFAFPAGIHFDFSNPVTIAFSWERIVRGKNHAESISEFKMLLFNGDDIYRWKYRFNFGWDNDVIKITFRRRYEFTDGYYRSIAQGGSPDNTGYYSTTGWRKNKYEFINGSYEFIQDIPSAITLMPHIPDIDQFWIQNYCRGMPVYDLAPLGAYNEFGKDEHDDTYFQNSGVSMSVLELTSKETIGRIQWSRYGAMPDLNEYVLNEVIHRIIPMKSLMPTDEHNTILVFTKHNVYRLALFGASQEQCVAIKELSGVGLVSKHGLTEIDGGIAFLSTRGLALLTASGLQYVSKQRVSLPSKGVLSYSRGMNSLVVYNNELPGVSLIYQILHDIWVKYTKNQHPYTFLGDISGSEAWWSNKDFLLHQFSNSVAGAAGTKIKTKAYSIGRRLFRYLLMAKAFTGSFSYRIKFIGAKITGGSITTPANAVPPADQAYLSGDYNKLTSIPATRSDYAQFEIVNANEVTAIQLEVEE